MTLLVSRLVGVRSWLSGGWWRRGLSLVLKLLQGLHTSTVASTVNAAGAKWQWHPQARNVIVTRESTAVVDAAALRLLLDTSLDRNTQGISLEA